MENDAARSDDKAAALAALHEADRAASAPAAAYTPIPWWQALLVGAYCGGLAVVFERLEGAHAYLALIGLTALIAAAAHLRHRAVDAPPVDWATPGLTTIKLATAGAAGVSAGVISLVSSVSLPVAVVLAVAVGTATTRLSTVARARAIAAHLGRR